jgi:DNA-directed RNA polymerase subunit RPC12/RpoP
MVNYLCSMCGAVVTPGINPTSMDMVQCSGCNNVIYLISEEKTDLKGKIKKSTSPEDLVFLLSNFQDYGESSDEGN